MEYLIFLGIGSIIFMLGAIYGISYTNRESIVSKEWDLKLNSLLDDGITSLAGSYIIKFGNIGVWRTGSSMGQLYIKGETVISLSPKIATKKRLLEAVQAYEIQAIQNAKK